MSSASSPSSNLAVRYLPIIVWRSLDTTASRWYRVGRRARRAGAIRRGVDSRDIGALVGAAIMAAQHAERDEDWRRYVQVVLDGLRG